MGIQRFLPCRMYLPAAFGLVAANPALAAQAQTQQWAEPARSVLARWQCDYNTVRPHSKLGGRTPAQIAGQRAWGHATTPVAILSNIQQEGQRLYS